MSSRPSRTERTHWAPIGPIDEPHKTHWSAQRRPTVIGGLFRYRYSEFHRDGLIVASLDADRVTKPGEKPVSGKAIQLMLELQDITRDALEVYVETHPAMWKGYVAAYRTDVHWVLTDSGRAFIEAKTSGG